MRDRGKILASHDRSQNSVHNVGSRRAQLREMNSLRFRTRGPTAARSAKGPSSASRRSSVPGCSSLSGFRKNTYSPRTSASAWLFALGNPRFSWFSISRTAGNLVRTAATEPSLEPLSTTMISWGIAAAQRAMDSRHATSSRAVLKLTMRMVTTLIRSKLAERRHSPQCSDDTVTGSTSHLLERGYQLRPSHRPRSHRLRSRGPLPDRQRGHLLAAAAARVAGDRARAKAGDAIRAGRRHYG